MTKDVTFVHMTDLHINAPGVEDPHLYTDTTTTLETIKAQVLALQPQPSFIIVSGDLTNRGDTDSYRELQRLMADIDIPVIYTLGNHDTRAGFYEGMLGRSTNLDAPVHASHVIGGIHIIALDSSTPGRVGGTIEPEQFDWLDDELSQHPGVPKILVVHHAPFTGTEPDPLMGWESIDFEDSMRLADMIRDRGVIGIFSGHVHYDQVSIWNGVPIVVGMGQHAATDILYQDGLRMVRGASFTLCRLRPTGLNVAFVPLPADRVEVMLHRFDFIARADQQRAAQAAE